MNMDNQTQHEILFDVVRSLVSACANARDMGEDIPDWLDELDDEALAALDAVGAS